MKVREHRGSLADSMRTVREVAGREELFTVIRETLAPFGVLLQPEQITVKPYGGRDERIGWDTHLISVQGYGVWGMADGPIE
jgi:hypothetical protein